MASPTFTLNSVGNLLAAQSLAANANVAVLCDFTTKIEGQVTARVTTGGTSTALSYTKNEGYDIYGSTTLNGGVSAAGTSIVVTSATGFAKGQKIVIENEVRTVSNVSGTTLTIDALQNNHSNGVAIYLIEQTPTFAGIATMGGTASTTYIKTTYMSTGRYAFVLTNTDASNAVTCEITSATVDSFS